MPESSRPPTGDPALIQSVRRRAAAAMVVGLFGSGAVAGAMSMIRVELEGMEAVMTGSARLVCVALLALGPVACSSNGEDQDASPATTEASVNPTEGASTDEITGDTADGVFDLTFDGSECTVAEPTEVPPGEYTFVLTDVSDLEATLFARELLDGRTFQDLLDAQEEAGGPGSYLPRPAWAGSVMSDFTPPSLDLAENQQAIATVLEPGSQYFVALWSNTVPAGIWLCALVDVVET